MCQRVCYSHQLFQKTSLTAFCRIRRGLIDGRCTGMRCSKVGGAGGIVNGMALRGSEL